MLSDIIILVTKKNVDILKTMLPYVRRNIKEGGDIYVISKTEIEETINSIEGCRFVDEDDVFPGLTYERVSTLISAIGGDPKKTGWYLQQFLKLAWCYKSASNDYIVFDADTIPLSPLSFIDVDGKYVFTKKTEYNKPYFDTINNLFNGRVARCSDFSFVAEHMIFSVQYVKEMIVMIDNNDALIGDSFFEKIIFAVGKEHLMVSGFSEFETYGNYMMTFHPQLCTVKSYRTQREAVYVIGSNPSKKQLDWAAKSYDIISIEVNNYGPTVFTVSSSIPLVRMVCSMRTLCKARFVIRRIYRRLFGKEDFVLEENL